MLFLASDPALSIWSGSTDSKILYKQRTPNAKGVSNSDNSLTQIKPLEYKT